VHREITSLFRQNKVILRQTNRPVTPYCGIAVFVAYPGKMGYREAVREYMPITLTSPNAIDPVETFTAFMVSVLAGARRFAHAGLLRLDRALHCAPKYFFAAPSLGELATDWYYTCPRLGVDWENAILSSTTFRPTFFHLRQSWIPSCRGHENEHWFSLLFTGQLRNPGLIRQFRSLSRMALR
jgi:hypothetical protein